MSAATRRKEVMNFNCEKRLMLIKRRDSMILFVVFYNLQCDNLCAESAIRVSQLGTLNTNVMATMGHTPVCFHLYLIHSV